MRRRARAALAALAVLPAQLASGGAAAREVAGVEFPARSQGPAGAALALCGAGIRRALFFEVYAVGLYLPACPRDADAGAAIAAPGAKRVSIAMLRDVGARDFVEALEGNLRNNHSEAEMAALAPGIAQLEAILGEQGVAARGTRIALDLVPGVGTVVAFDGRARGAPIPGEDFYRALLRNWLGQRPVSGALKRALLGGGDE